MQYYFSEYMDDLLLNYGSIDRNMYNSPHIDFADKYYKNGKSWTMNNFVDTKYYKFLRYVKKTDGHIPMRKISLMDSIKKGYLMEGHEEDFIVILDMPLIETRYNIKSLGLKSPEMFMGHHRAAALMALGINKVEVIIAEDIKVGECDIKGKLANNYRKILECGQKDMN